MALFRLGLPQLPNGSLDPQPPLSHGGRLCPVFRGVRAAFCCLFCPSLLAAQFLRCLLGKLPDNSHHGFKSHGGRVWLDLSLQRKKRLCRSISFFGRGGGERRDLGFSGILLRGGFFKEKFCIDSDSYTFFLSDILNMFYRKM